MNLPEKPLVSIRAGGRGAPIDLKSLWDYRELLYFLTWRDVKVRYKQTALGAAWAIIQPLFTMIIFTIFFGKLANMPSDGIPYPIFAYSALLPWTFFSNAITSSGNSLVGSANLVTKVYFPRLALPVSSVLAGLVDLALALVVLVGLMLFYGVVPPVAMPITTSFGPTFRASTSFAPPSGESSAPSCAMNIASFPPAMTPSTIPGDERNVGGHSLASSTPSRPLVPAPK